MTDLKEGDGVYCKCGCKCIYSEPTPSINAHRVWLYQNETWRMTNIDRLTTYQLTDEEIASFTMFRLTQ
jgi:hypothetical protein